MKAILGMLVFLSMANANALVCSLQKENPAKKGTFDQPVFKTGAIEVLKNGVKSQIILIKPDNSVVESYDFSSIKNADDLKAIDKSVMMIVQRIEDQTLSIGLGKVDVSNKDNMTTMTSMAFASEGKLLVSFDYTQSMAISCVNQ